MITTIEKEPIIREKMAKKRNKGSCYSSIEKVNSKYFPQEVKAQSFDIYADPRELGISLASEALKKLRI